jgi:hypothetical protein
MTDSTLNEFVKVSGGYQINSSGLTETTPMPHLTCQYLQTEVRTPYAPPDNMELELKLRVLKSVPLFDKYTEAMQTPGKIA